MVLYPSVMFKIFKIFKILVFAPVHHHLAVQDTCGPGRIRIVELFRLEKTLKIIQCCFMPEEEMIRWSRWDFLGSEVNKSALLNEFPTSVCVPMDVPVFIQVPMGTTRRMWRRARCLPMWITRNMVITWNTGHQASAQHGSSNALPALGALVGLPLSVGPLVWDQGRTLVEALPTLQATVGPLPSVDTPVFD